MKKILSLALSLIVSLGTFAGTIKPPKGYLGKVYNSTLALYGSMNGKTHFICTAWPYEKTPGGYHLISAGHCVQLLPEGIQFSVADEIGGKLSPVTVYKTRLEPGIDFTVFELKTDKIYAVLPMGDESDSRIGDTIVNGNFTEGIVKQVTYGLITSSTIPVGECLPQNCAGEFVVNAFGGTGASGSAIISAKTHKVIGILTWGFDAAEGYGVEPISSFASFMSKPTQVHPVPKDDDDADVEAIIKAITGK